MQQVYRPESRAHGLTAACRPVVRSTGLSVGDAVAVTRARQQTVYYAVAAVGFTQIDPPSIVNRPGFGTVPLD